MYICIYTESMEFEWDEKKRRNNLEKHGLDFALATKLWKSPMLIVADKRFDYQEQRWAGMGLLEGRVMVVIFTQRPNEIIRFISFRKANRREVRAYEKAIKKS